MYKKILFLLFIIILSGCVEINLIKKTVINTEKVWLGSIDFSGYYNVEPIKNNPKLIWYFNNPPYPVPNTPFIYKPIFINSPLVYEGYVYFSDKDGNFYALDEKNGNLIWKVHFENSYEITTPTLANDIIFIGVCNLGIIGLNSKNGEIKFKLYNDDYFPAPPIIIDSMLYFLSIKPSWQHLNIYINAFNIEKSRYIYKRRFETNTKSPIFLISKESLVFYNEYIKSFLYNIDLKSGKIKWKKDIPNILNRTIPFDSNKIFIFTFNENLKLFTIDIDNGNILCIKDISNNIIEPQNVLLVTDKNNLY
ncbi:MAG: PQQ-like beta-propeller repeat protein, partial [Caldisericia bacterium]|nr:PQQ-like beta-propeller repeat protein [Caldisericia bacterium]